MNATPRRKGHRLRGAVLVETALVVGVILTMLLFSIQVGVLGFLQLTFDAASFVDARFAAVGVADTSPAGHANATSTIFPQIAPAQIASTVAPAPSPTVPVNYGYNDPNAANQAASLTNRHGGVSMMLPAQQTSTITKPAFFSLFGKKVGVGSQSIDALWLECGIHVNVSNGNAGCSPAAAGVGSAAYQGNYFTTGENAPPYFVGLNHIHHCTDAQPWTTCSTVGTDYLALGSAAFLHGPAGLQVGNWLANSPGAGGDAGATTFWLMGCHQRTYAIIAAGLAPFPDLQAYYSAFPNAFAVANGYPATTTNAQAIFAQMYNFDGNYPAFPTTASRRGMNDFQTGALSLAVANNGGWILNFDLKTNQYIGRVYAWDTEVVAGAQPGTVGSNATHPEAYCSYP